MKKLCFIFALSLSFQLLAQNVEIQGSAKITQMDQDNTQQDLVVRQPDGTLGTRSISSLPSNTPIDTTKNLASDFELASHLCDCGTDLPPFLIKSLKDSGYSDQDLLDAGVPFANIFAAKPIIDADGNEYTTIEIGTQVWLRENLKTTKFNDGTAISLLEVASEWEYLGDNGVAAYCWYNNDISNKEDFGALYNWFAISPTTNVDKNVCPIGFRVPVFADFNSLISSLGSPIGPKIKEYGLEYWNTLNGAINSSGFDAKGSGLRDGLGVFQLYKSYGYWWRQDDLAPDYGGTAFLQGSTSNFTIFSGTKDSGLAVRCIKE